MRIRSAFENAWLSILIAPLFVLFLIVACIMAGPSEAIKIATGRK